MRLEFRLFPRIFHQTIKGAESVLPADLFSLLVSPAPVADAHLIDPEVAARDFDGDLGLEAKAVLFNRDGLDHFAAEYLVTSLHVREVDVGKAIGEQGQEPVANRVPEVEDAVRAAAEEAGTVDDVSFSLDERIEEMRILRRIVLEVRVLNDDEIPVGFLNTAAQSRALPHVFRLQQDANLRI